MAVAVKFGVIFDNDGVLVDSEHISLKAYRQAIREQGVELREEDREDPGPQPPLDLGHVGREDPEPEGEEVVGDAVDPAAGASGVLGHRHRAFHEAELGEPFRRDAMKKPVVVAGIDPADMRPQPGV